MTPQYEQFKNYLEKHYPFTKRPGSRPIHHQTRVSFQGTRGFQAPVELYISAFSGFTKGEYKLLCVFREDDVVYDVVANHVVQQENALTNLMRVLAPTGIKSDYVGKVMKTQGCLTEEQLETLFDFVKAELSAAIPVWGPAYEIEACFC